MFVEYFNCPGVLRRLKLPLKGVGAQDAASLPRAERE